MARGRAFAVARKRAQIGGSASSWTDDTATGSTNIEFTLRTAGETDLAGRRRRSMCASQAARRCRARSRPDRHGRLRGSARVLVQIGDAAIGPVPWRSSETRREKLRGVGWWIQPERMARRIVGSVASPSRPVAGRHHQRRGLESLRVLRLRHVGSNGKGRQPLRVHGRTYQHSFPGSPRLGSTLRAARVQTDPEHPNGHHESVRLQAQMQA